MSIFRKPPDAEPPPPPPQPSKPLPVAIKCRCGLGTRRHCGNYHECRWQCCSCGRWTFLHWDPELEAWLGRVVRMAKDTPL